MLMDLKIGNVKIMKLKKMRNIMICKLCKKKEVTDSNPKIHICDICRMEIELSFRYFVAGKEVTQEEYNRRIADAF
jgi:ribosomal protein L37AE/L43A